MHRSINVNHLLLDEFLPTLVSLGLDKAVGLEDSPPSSQSSLLDSPQLPKRLVTSPLDLPGSLLPASNPSSPSSPLLGQCDTECVEPPIKIRRTSIHQLGSSSLIPKRKLPTPSSKNPSSSQHGTPPSSIPGPSGATSQPPAKVTRTSTRISKVAPKSPRSASSPNPPSEETKSELDLNWTTRRCPECGLKVHRCSYARHLETHEDKDMLLCDLCSQRFTRLDHLTRHRNQRCSRWDSLTCNTENRLIHSITDQGC